MEFHIHTKADWALHLAEHKVLADAIAELEAETPSSSAETGDSRLTHENGPVEAQESSPPIQMTYEEWADFNERLKDLEAGLQDMKKTLWNVVMPKLEPGPPLTFWDVWRQLPGNQRITLEGVVRGLEVRLAALEPGPPSPPSGQPIMEEAPPGETPSTTTEGGLAARSMPTPPAPTSTPPGIPPSPPLAPTLPGDAEPD